MNGVEIEPDQWGDSKQASEKGWIGQTKSSLLKAYWMGLIFVVRLSPFSQVMSESLPCPAEGEAIFPVHVVGMELSLLPLPLKPGSSVSSYSPE
jgi:hypothetical protein